MKELLSPKQVASSIGVSESSLKRWCDQGVLTTERTPGGHRRIRIGEVVRFLRENQHSLVKPEALGLPQGSGQSQRSMTKAQDALFDALNQGQIELARRIVIDQYLAGTPILKVCEELITTVLHRIGDSWECGDWEIYQEHRSCETLNRVLYDIRLILPPPPPDAPLAMGGTPTGDNYRLASLMVELLLVDAGWNAVSLGSSLPYSTLIEAAKRQEPRLFWLSFSHVVDESEALEGINSFIHQVPEQTHLMLGGREAPKSLPQSDRLHVCRNFSDLMGLVDKVAVATS